MTRNVSKEYLDAYITLTTKASRLMELSQRIGPDHPDFQKAVRERDEARAKLIEVVEKEDNKEGVQ